MSEIILTSSVLILIVAALRRLLRGKIAPALQYALWLLVAARLLIPGTLFSAPVTVVGLADEMHSIITSRNTDEAPSGLSPDSSIYVPDQTIVFAPSPVPQPSIPSDSIDPAPQMPLSPVPHDMSVDWLDLIWKTGIIVVSAAFLVSNLIFYRRLRSARQKIPSGELPIRCSVPVYLVSGLSAPCLLGNAIYLNEKALDSTRLPHVLTHELTHRRHGDRLWSLLRCVCLALHWYNPLVWWAASLSRRDCELCCDSAVIRKLGIHSGISYGETLMAMLTSSPTNLLHAATTMSAGKQTMTERLKLIVRRPKTTKLAVISLALVTVAAVGFTFGGCADEISTSEPDPTITDNADKNEPDSIAPSDENEQLAPPENGFGYIPTYADYTHPSGLFSVKLLALLEERAVFTESEDGFSLYDIQAYQSGSENGWILSVHPQPSDWNGTQNPFLTLAVFDPNGTSQNYILEYSTGYSEEYSALRDLISESFTLLASSEQFSRLIHDNYESNMALAVSYLPYLSWRNYRAVYGEEALMPLISALRKFADTGSANWDQYHDLLSVTNDGLDGAYSEGLSSVFEALFMRNQEQFLSVINSRFITDTERARVASYVKYRLGSEPDKSDSEEVVFNDLEIIQSLSRAYSPTVWSTGSPTDLTLTLTGDWTLEGIRAAIFEAVSERIAGTLLEGDLSRIEIAYSFRFPDAMHDGVVLTVPFHAAYVDQDVYTLPSGAAHSPSSRTGELTATILLTGEGITAPVDEEFARGQAIYDLLAQTAAIDEEITASLQSESFDLLDAIHKVIERRLADAALSDICQTTSMSCGGYYNPVWCDVGYEQTVEYTVTFLYSDGDVQYQYEFRHTVKLVTTE